MDEDTEQAAWAQMENEAREQSDFRRECDEFHADFKQFIRSIKPGDIDAPRK